MRTIQTTVYTFDELEGEAQANAYGKWLESFDYPWHSENIESLYAFTKLFGVGVRDYSYGACNSFINIEVCSAWEDLTGLRLWKVLNTIYHDNLKGKYYITAGRIINGKYTYKKRYSKVLKGEPYLTGYDADWPLMTGLKEWLDNPCLSDTYKDVMYSVCQDWLIYCNNDYIGSMSEECFKAECADNEYEFTEDGRKV